MITLLLLLLPWVANGIEGGTLACWWYAGWEWDWGATVCESGLVVSCNQIMTIGDGTPLLLDGVSGNTNA